MDWNRVAGNWKQIKGKIKEQWGKLTDDDLDEVNGRREQLEGKIQDAMASKKIVSKKTLTTGTPASPGKFQALTQWGLFYIHSQFK